MSDWLDDYDYHLPPELIASEPLPERDASRMLVIHRKSRLLEHRTFREFPKFVSKEDIVVLNNSRVIRARIKTQNPRGEVFLAERIGELRWVCLVRPGKKWPVGAKHPVAGTQATVLEILPGGERVVEFDSELDLERFGSVPLPPYICREPRPSDGQRYQTVYAGPEGSVAAPTAGLHFTPEILAKIPHCFVTLHVGLGTFQPVKTRRLSEHRMHEERYVLSESAAKAINAAKRVFAVGTTVVRVLESQPLGPLQAREGRTSLFIYPPFEFRHVDAILTNFHLPRSTLIALVSAFAGRELILEAYHEAIREQYRFYSYGDCMLLLD